MKFKKILFLFFIMIAPIKVFANSFECPKVATLGEEISCHLKLENVIGVNANYSFGNNFTYLDVVSSGNWKVYYKDKIGVVLGNIIDSSAMDITIKLKVADNLEINKDYSLGITNIEATDKNGNLVTLSDVNTSIKIVSNNAYLKELSLNNIKFTEKFNKDKYIYYANTVKDNTVISAKAEEQSATISGDIGKKNLKYGVNLFIVKVTSVYGGVKEYKIYITRTYEKRDGDATLKNIILSSGNIDFKKDKFLYEISVGNEVDTIDVDAVASSSKSTIEIEKPDKLEIGENKIVITVTAEDKTQCQYVLLITRADNILIDQNDDDKLESEIDDNKKNNDTFKTKNIIYIGIALLVLILLFVLIIVVKKMINYIKKNFKN